MRSASRTTAPLEDPEHFSCPATPARYTAPASGYEQKELVARSTLYLPIFVDGALLGGHRDGHAV